MIVTALFSVAQAADVLVCFASPYNPDVMNKLTATGRFAVVDEIDCSNSTPSAAQLASYDAVLIYSDFPFANPSLLGDRLADFVDGGGGVVEGMFSMGSLPITGRYRSGGYQPIVGSLQDQGTALDLVIDDAAHPILAGVVSFNGGIQSYHAPDAALAANAQLQGHWSNGRPLIATLDTHNGITVGLNFYPPSDRALAEAWDENTDGDLILANALEFAGFADIDLDGLFGADDNCPSDPNPDQEDVDGDAVGDLCDNCLDAPNADQRDADQDTYGQACDCDDRDEGLNPAETELCDGEDDDCDGVIDDDALDAGQLFTDADGDGQGDAGAPVAACEEGDGLVANDADCDDSSAEVKVGATELCDDAVDNDCDGNIDPVDVCPVTETPTGDGDDDDDDAPANFGGCGCAQGSPGALGSGLLVLLAAVIRRRRLGPTESCDEGAVPSNEPTASGRESAEGRGCPARSAVSRITA